MVGNTGQVAGKSWTSGSCEELPKPTRPMIQQSIYPSPYFQILTTNVKELVGTIFYKINFVKY